MITNTHTNLKQHPQVPLKPKSRSTKIHNASTQNSEHLNAMHQVRTEYVKNMWTARYIALGEVIMLVLMIFGLFAIYQRHGHVQTALLECVGITSLSIIVQVTWTWHKTRGFFSELNKNRTVRKYDRHYNH